MNQWLLGGALLLCAALGHSAGAPSTLPIDGMGGLRKIAGAAQQLNYTGTFVYQHAGRMESWRITHLVDARGEQERLETLDGAPREVTRINDEVTCFYPDSKAVRIEKRASRRFPALFEQLTGILDHYTVHSGGIDRVAGFDCRTTTLKPKDQLRYGQQLCAELNTGMPLRVRTFNERNETVEVFAFTQIEIGGQIAREKVKGRYSVGEPGWRVDRSTVAEVPSAESGWTVQNIPAGFRKIFESARTIQGRSATHLVYSDGIAAVSVFVQPADTPRGTEELSQQGAINVYSRLYPEHVVTILGETPVATVKQFANSISFRNR